MRVVFTIPKSHPQGGDKTEEVDFPNGTTEDEIQDGFVTWVMEQTDAYWERG